MSEFVFKDEEKAIVPINNNFIQRVRNYFSKPDDSIAFVTEADTTISSNVSDNKTYDGWISPIVSFTKCQEYYYTVGKVANTVESFINQIINRDWYFDGDEGTDNDIKILKTWEGKVHLSLLFENVVRDWLINGNNIIGKSDFIPVQMESIVGLKRSSDGITTLFGQITGDNKIKPLDAEKFIHTKYTGLSRASWGLPLYNSLMTTFSDIDGRGSQPLLALYRQSLQDNSKIHHRMGSPRSIWFFDVAKEVMRNEIKPLIKGMKAGDRLTLNKKPEIISEQIDGQTRFTEATKQLNDEVESGLQSSASRLITQPSAMADAKEAGSQDDERVKGIMEKLRRLMDEIVIPLVLRKTPETCKVSFKWGTKDSFQLNYPDGLRNLLADGIINEEIVRHILTKRLNWDIPEDLLNNMIKQKEINKASMTAIQSIPQKQEVIDEEDLKKNEMLKQIEFLLKHESIKVNDEVNLRKTEILKQISDNLTQNNTVTKIF